MYVEDGDVTTVLIDSYLVSSLNGKTFSPQEGGLEFTGEVHYLEPTYLVRMDLTNGESIIFDTDDAIELTGRKAAS